MPQDLISFNNQWITKKIIEIKYKHRAETANLIIKIYYLKELKFFINNQIFTKYSLRKYKIG